MTVAGDRDKIRGVATSGIVIGGIGTVGIWGKSGGTSGGIETISIWVKLKGAKIIIKGIKGIGINIMVWG